MKWIFSRFALFVVLWVVVSSAFAAPVAYKFDPQHTYVQWHINHFGFSNPSGKWLAEGTLLFDKDKPQNSKVNITIQVGNIVTGIPELDDHLKGKLFFDVGQFPTATFLSDKVTVTGKNSAKVHGILTMHGISKPVTLNVTLNKSGLNPITNKMSLGFSATTQINRSEFNITTLLPGVGDTVKISIEAEAYQETA